MTPISIAEARRRAHTTLHAAEARRETCAPESLAPVAGSAPSDDAIDLDPAGLYTPPMTDTDRLDKLARYLSDPAKNISGPFNGDESWQLGYNAGPAYVIDAQGRTLRECIDCLPNAEVTG